jgi:hypothetical protein
MSKITYTIKQDSMGADYIEGVIGDSLMIIPTDPANSDYQEYLNPSEAKTL